MPIPQSYDNFGVSFTYIISSKSIKESVNPEQVKKSSEQEAPNGVHLAVLNHLDEVIGESIEVEEHPDYKKDENGERKPENGWNDDVLVHRFVGAITVDGQTYRVKTTMLEYAQKDWGDRQYAYDVAKIEVLDKTPNTTNGLNEAANGRSSLANILKNVEKSYDSGKLLLDESAKEDRKREIQNTQNGSGGGRARFMVSSESDADYMDAVEKGDVVYADIPYENTHQDGYRGGKFDKQAFVEWAQAQDVPVYVSEYSMPEDWTEVASFDVRGVRGGKRPEKLFVQSKFAGEYERRMQEESGDDVRFMRGSELEEMRRRPLVTRSHPVPTDEELRDALCAGIGSFNSESIEELETLEQLAGGLGLKANVSVRINPDVDAHTHRFITTGLEMDKFGIPKKDMDRVIALFKSSKNLNFKGLHFHIGSQITDVENVFTHECISANGIVSHFESQGLRVDNIDLGGGLGVDYYNPDSHAIPEFGLWFQTLTEHLRHRPDQRIHVEPGRALVAQCASLVSRVIFVKDGERKSFVILDAGMNDLLRPALYGAYHKIENLTYESDELRLYDVVGPVCETTDLFAEDRTLPLTRRGDLVAIRSAGAYGAVMSSTYNMRKPARTVFSDEPIQ